MKKLSTGIKGLDALFHGGIQLHNMQDGHDDGVIIALKGMRGCNKTMLAMQLMHGLTKSIEKYNRGCNCMEYTDAPVFISLNKSESNLKDMYMDMCISRLINELCFLYLKGGDNDVNRESIDMVLSAIMRHLFERNIFAFCSIGWNFIVTENMVI